MNIGNPFGIRLNLHWSFFLVLGWIGFTALVSSGIAGAVFSTIFVASIFGCVVLHELGHSLAARHYGIPTNDITLYPIGGVASLARMPRDPTQELVIAVAGPLVNVAIAILLIPLALLLGFPDIGAVNALTPASVSHFIWALLGANVMMILFNMIPAFPMDGGRVLRALLAMRGNYSQATHLAARTGQVIAVAFGLFGLFNGHFMLSIIAIFIFLAAGSERRSVMMQEQFAGFGSTAPPQPTFRPAGQQQAPRVVIIRDDELEVLPPR